MATMGDRASFVTQIITDENSISVIKNTFVSLVNATFSVHFNNNVFSGTLKSSWPGGNAMRIFALASEMSPQLTNDVIFIVIQDDGQIAKIKALANGKGADLDWIS